MEETASVFILLLFFLFSNSRLAAAQLLGNETDHLALLDFKDRLADPAGTLSSWNDTIHFCLWEGVTCNNQRNIERVTALNLTSRGLAGAISPFIANLTFLRSVDLSSNGFYGEILPEFGNLRQLQHLDLSSNSFQGGIPINLTTCHDLRSLYLYGNKLTGKIPLELGSLSKLNIISLGSNNISGLIPPSLGNLTFLTRLGFALNQLEGRIPHELGKLTSLVFFQVGENMLSGEIPPSLYNLSSLISFGVAFNYLLNGSLPSSLWITLPNLEQLMLGGNQFQGPLPASLTNMTSLVLLDITYNNFTGRVPPDLGRLYGLYHVSLGLNQFEANDADDWMFLESLNNCSRLRKLLLEENKFGGIMPPSVGNLSIQLQDLAVGSNQISGTIPSGIGNLINLKSLEMPNNIFTGAIPESIGKLSSLSMLDLTYNQLSGEIPSTLGNLTQLLQFRLEANNLEGPIPPALGNFQSLIEFDLSHNRLSGVIPGEILRLPYLESYMDLSYNNLNGPLPGEVGNLKRVTSLALSQNKLSGEIPGTLGDCKSLMYLAMDGNFLYGTIPQSLGNILGLKRLDLSYNNLSGPIPQSFSKLRGLQELYLSYNNLSGSVPKFLVNLTSLSHLNLSFNQLQGEVPIDGIFRNASAISILGNNELCGGIQRLHLHECPLKSDTKSGGWFSHTKGVVLVVAPILCLLLLVSFVYVCWKRKLASILPSLLPALDNQDQFPRVSYRDLIRVTDGFSSVNRVGQGRYGSVYKGRLNGSNIFVAVKVFNLLERGASKSFLAECEVLRNIRHRNLIKILTVCSSVDSKGNDFKALVFEFMANGSLDKLLHSGDVSTDQANKTLSLIQRLNIAIDVATALEYLHNNCQPPIVHCDLKPSNVLLDDDMRALVSDFGLAKLLSQVASNSLQDSYSSIGIRGTIGYVAPEYGAGCQVSTAGDIYSFGILILELFTGKRPTDNMFDNDSDLRKYVEVGMSLERVSEIADPLMLLQPQLLIGCNVQESLASVMRVGLLCSNQLSSQRMNIRDAAAELCLIREAYLRVEQHGDRSNG